MEELTNSGMKLLLGIPLENPLELTDDLERLTQGNITPETIDPGYENNIDLGLVTSFFLENADPNDEYALTAYTNQADGVDDMFDGNQSWYNIFGEQENSLSLTSP